MNTKEFQTLYNINVVETCTVWDINVLPLPSNAAMEWGKRDTEYYDTRRLQTYEDTVHILTWAKVSALGKDLTECMRKLKERIEESHQKPIRNSERSFERAFFTFHQYRSESLLSEVGIPQLGRASTLHKASYGSSSVNMEKTWEDGMENPVPS